MIYSLCIDWLTIFCNYMGEGQWQPKETERFRYKVESFGTRCFSLFVRARVPNEEGGFDEFAEVQAHPYSSVLPPFAVMVRFTNRTLYTPDFWECADAFLIENNLSANGISRIDICADFNQFSTIDPKALIEGFAAKKFRHIGRGVGALYFNHGIGAEHDLQGHPVKDYGVCYTGLSFGNHSSDAHVYLYNKSEELKTQGDKPWIRDTWKAAGLDQRHVWRLEVSIKSKGLKFRDKTTKQNINVDIPMIYDTASLDKIYHTFVKRLFSFILNKPHISNVTREPRLKLFEGAPAYDRGVIRNVSAGGRMERILLKQLYFLADKYRGVWDARERAESLARSLAKATDLSEWYALKRPDWEKPIHK